MKRAGSPAGGGEHVLLVAARDGDEAAFVRLTAAHRRPLHLHAYRLLGSLHDADDALQETLLRAWRGLPSYEPRGALSAWLQRIATNVALRMIEQRRAGHTVIDAHLEPYPDRLLDELAAPGLSPEDHVLQRESIGLAYVAALQLLAPKQRVVLVLRDGLGWTARETAEHLGDSVPAVNSALQRARDRIARERDEGTMARLHAPASTRAEAAVITAFVDAWAVADIPRIMALLTDDALLTMPPLNLRFNGPDAIGTFFATQPAQGHLERIKHVETRANGQPALASYADEDAIGTHDAYGLMVFAIRGQRIAGITGFPRQPELFDQFGLPLTLP
jgi:RNA polymerase sigma-70 factor (ECF subfamily)